MCLYFLYLCLDQNSVSTYLDPISLDTNQITDRKTFSSTSHSFNKTKPGEPLGDLIILLKVHFSNILAVYSPYYTPVLNQRQYSADTADSYGAPEEVDSYGAPVLDPISLPPEYPDYQYPLSVTGSGTGEAFVTGTGYGAPSAPVISEPEYYTATGSATGTATGSGTGSATGSASGEAEAPAEISQ